MTNHHICIKKNELEKQTHFEVVTFYLEFDSNTGLKTSKKFSFELLLAGGTESSNCGSTLSYDFLFVVFPSVSQARVKNQHYHRDGTVSSFMNCKCSKVHILSYTIK